MRPRHSEQYYAVLGLKLAGVRNRDVCRDLNLSRHQVSGLVSRLKDSGALPRLVPKVSRPRRNPLHKPVKAQERAAPRKIGPPRTRRYPKLPSVPLPRPRKPILTAHMKPVGLFQRTGCAFPVNDGKPFLFCDAPIHSPTAYCEFHGNLMVKRQLGVDDSTSYAQASHSGVESSV